MSNFCSIGPTADFVGTAWTDATANVYNGIGDLVALKSAAQYATVSSPTVFDADAYNIKCVAFPSAGGAGDSLIGLASRISSLETSNVNLQNQVAALAAGTVAAPLNPDLIEASSYLFAAVLLALVLVQGGKHLYNILMPGKIGGQGE